MKKKTVQFINSELLELPVSVNGNLARRKVSVKVVLEINDANGILCIFYM